MELLDADGNVVAPTTTGADGSYNFTGVAPGNYTERDRSQWLHQHHAEYGAGDRNPRRDGNRQLR